MMKKIIIVNNDMKIGGVQKSLYNLLWTIDGKYDVTLCLFGRTGAYADALPPSVRVVTARGAYRYLGVSQLECRRFDRLMRGALAVLTRIFGRKRVVGMMKCRQPELDEKYDCAIAYLQNGRRKAFYGGVQDFVLDCVSADKKVAFLHCDFGACGANNRDNEKLLERFDTIAACSDGCRDVFCSVLPHLADKCVSVRNCHRFDEIRKLADEDSIIYNEEFVNVLVAARLTHEKGVERAITAVEKAVCRGLPVRLHVVGDGAMRGELEELVRERALSDSVIFYGEQRNPYRFMKNADLLFIPSYHEAAPMVIDEAICLGLPVLTTKTTSAYEMVGEEHGRVCENSQKGIDAALFELLENKEVLRGIRRNLLQKENNNDVAILHFEAMLSV